MNILLSLLFLFVTIYTVASADCEIKKVGAQTCRATVSQGASQCLRGYKLTKFVSSALGGMISPGECSICDVGKTAESYMQDTTTDCVLCPANYYCDQSVPNPADDIPIKACGQGAFSAAGSTAQSDCKCNDGLGQDASNNCTPCSTPGCKHCSKNGGGIETCTQCFETKGYAETPDSNACVACTNGCASCLKETPSVCLTDACQPGYRFRNVNSVKSCVQCTPECKTCTSSSAGEQICASPQDGYYFNLYGQNTQCPVGCSKCSFTAPITITCLQVSPGFYLKTQVTSKATQCPQGTTSTGGSVTYDSDEKACTLQCSENCLKCNDAGESQCDLCQTNYQLDATTKTCSVINIHYTCATAQDDTETGCLTCNTLYSRQLVKNNQDDTTGQCQCLEGYVDQGLEATFNNTMRAPCLACGKNVKTCKSDLTPILCTDETYVILQFRCFAQNATLDGYFFNVDQNEFELCHSSCSSCLNNNIDACTGCAPLNQTVFNYTDHKNLTQAWTTVPLSPKNGTICWSYCPEGYKILNPNIRTQCDIDVDIFFSNILSAISTIVLCLILLF